MQRFLIVAATFALSATSYAQQQTITFASVPNGTFLPAASPAGLTLWGPGSIQNESIYVMGGDAVTTYLASSTGFTVNSLDVTSEVSTNNRIVLRGYTLTDITTWIATHPLEPDFFAALRSASQENVYPAPTSYSLQLTANPGVLTPIALNWTDLGALAFDSQGGDPVSPLAPGWPGYGYFADNITVTITPEPASRTLLASGLLALWTFGAGRSVRPRVRP